LCENAASLREVEAAKPCYVSTKTNNNRTLYTGATNNLERRVLHTNASGCRIHQPI